MKNGVKKDDKTSINTLTYIVGNIKAEENLIVNGKVKGNIEIRNHNLFLSSSGKIKGNIYAKNVKIRGQMIGEIQATGRVEIAREAKFSGEIKCKSVSVEKGAYFDANVCLGRKPLEKVASEDTPKVAERSEIPKVQ